MKIAKKWALALLTLALLCPAVTPSAQADGNQEEPKSLSPAIQPPDDGGDPVGAPVQNARIERAMRSLTRQLGLTEDQAERMKPMLAKHHADVQGLRAEFKDWPEESGRQAFRQDLQTMRAGFHDELTAVLSPEQLEKFKVLQKKNQRRAHAAQEPE